MGMGLGKIAQLWQNGYNLRNPRSNDMQSLDF
jgi:hypothetical protein